MSRFKFEPLPPLTIKAPNLKTSYDSWMKEEEERISTEFRGVANDFVALCKDVTIVTKLFLADESNMQPTYALADLLDADLKRWKKEAWTDRNNVQKEFYNAVSEIASTIASSYLSGDAAFFKAPDCPVKAYGQTAGNFIHVRKALFIRVWRSHKAARRFVLGFQRIATSIVEERVRGATVPMTTMLAYAGSFVTVTAIPPVRRSLALAMTKNASSSMLHQALRRVETAVSAATLEVGLGVMPNGKLVFFDVRNVLIESRSKISHLLRHESNQLVHENNKRSEILAASSKAAADALLHEVASRNPFDAEAFVSEGIITKCLHSRGITAKRLFNVYCDVQAIGRTQPARAPAVESALRALEIEMVLRTVRNMIWASMADVEKDAKALKQQNKIADAHMKVRAAALNRVCHMLVDDPESPYFWGEQIVATVREKFSAPPAFNLPYTKLVTPLMNLIGQRMGFNYDGATSRFEIAAASPVSSSVMPVNDICRVYLSKSKSPAQDEIIATTTSWKVCAETAPPGAAQFNMFVRMGFYGAALELNNLLDVAHKGLQKVAGESPGHTATLHAALAEIALYSPKQLTDLSSESAKCLKQALASIFAVFNLRQELEHVTKHRIKRALAGPVKTVAGKAAAAGNDDDDGGDDGALTSLNSRRFRGSIVSIQRKSPPPKAAPLLAASLYDAIFIHWQLLHYADHVDTGVCHVRFCPRSCQWLAQQRTSAIRTLGC
jgi:hypothetical protein